MKKINFLYLICMTMMGLVVELLLGILTSYHPAGLLLLPAYVGWFICSFPLFYSIKKRKGVKDGFETYYCMSAQWTTFWIDVANKELAYLCMFNPFKIQYIPLKFINRAEVEVNYTKDREYINHINCSFYIKNKKNKIRVETRGRYDLISAETRGKEILAMTQEFTELLNKGLYNDCWAARNTEYSDKANGEG